MFQPSLAYPFGIPQQSTDSADNDDAVVELTATAGRQHVISEISWSYDNAPTGGKLTIAYGTTTLAWWIIAGGPGRLPLNVVAAANQAVTITLAAGGTSVKSTLVVEHN